MGTLSSYFFQIASVFFFLAPLFFGSWQFDDTHIFSDGLLEGDTTITSDTVEFKMPNNRSVTYEVKDSIPYKILFFTDSLGNKHYAGTYDNGWGSIISYYPDGTIESVSIMHHKGGYRLSQLYYENGILRSSGIKYDPMIVLGRDTVIFKGDTSVIIEMSNTLQIGIWQYYDENGDLFIEELYDDDGSLLERRFTISD